MIKEITNFDIRKAIAIDGKTSVADSTARLAIKYPYKGLETRQADTGEIYRYITTTPVDGSLPTNISGDWELVLTLFTGAGTPATSKGVINDIWIDETNFIIYKKTGVATWTSLFSISGAHILTGVLVPTTEGVDGDMYVQSNGFIYTKAAGSWNYQFSVAGAAGVSDLYATTSSTSIDLDTITAPMSITVATGLAYTVGQTVIVASRADNANNVEGTVSSYTTGTGVLILAPITATGTGIFTDWDVNLTGAPGKQGKAFIHTEADINFNEAKVTSVEGGTWTPENPWSASIANDTRVSLIAPTALSGSKTGYSIAYDGTAWYNNGRWLGAIGPQGVQGIQGIQGIQGLTGANGLIPFTTIASPATVENKTKGWYFIDLLTTQNVILGGNNEVGTVLTICRTSAAIDGVIPPNSTYTASITKNSGASLNYKGRYVTTIPLNARNITFIVVATIVGVSYWKCIGEDASYQEDVKAAQEPTQASASAALSGGAVTLQLYPARPFIANAFTVPRIDYTFFVYRSAVDLNPFQYGIQYSTDNVSFFNLKSRYSYIQRDTVTYITVSAIDKDLAPGTTRYYRLGLSCSNAFYYSTVEDYLISSVPRY